MIAPVNNNMAIYEDIVDPLRILLRSCESSFVVDAIWIDTFVSWMAKRVHRARLNCCCGAPSRRPISKLSLAVFPFFVPGHLNSLQFAFVRLLWIAPKSRQFRNPFMHIGEPNRQRIQVRKFVR